MHWAAQGRGSASGWQHSLHGPRRRIAPAPPAASVAGETIEHYLGRLAREAFGAALRLKTEEALEQRQAFQATE